MTSVVMTKPVALLAFARAIGPNSRVGFVKGMAMNAVGLLASYSTMVIHLMSDWFQMGRIHAMAYSAQVIQFQPFGNWPNECLISESVSKNVGAWGTAEHERAIAIRPLLAKPQPTGISLIDMLPETQLRGHDRASHLEIMV